MLARRIAVWLAAAVICSPWMTPSVKAEITASQRESIREAIIAIKKAGNLFLQKDYRVSGDAISKAQKTVEELASDADAELLRELEPLVNRLRRAHALLELEGIKLAPLKDLTAKTADKPMPRPAPGAADAVSFSKHVAPMLVAKCGRCHVQRATGEFSMANFASLMKGSSAGVVIFPNDADGSRIVEVIDSGDMPRGGLKVTADEYATLKKWINQGAKFDGPDPQASLLTLTPGASPQAGPMLSVTKSTGKETVSFASDIAPIFNEQCAGCHGNGRRPQGRFNLTTFQGLLRGGESGAPIVPGKPAESLLVKMVRGTGGSQRMPAGGRPPLSEDVIVKIETWIKEGATFDAPNPNQHIREVAALAKAMRSNHEQLSADRAEAAQRNWKLGMPGIDADWVETDNFLLVGNIGEQTLADYGKQAEALMPQISSLFKVPADQPLVKGRITLYFFSQRYDYSEFGKMVEQRQLPSEWRGHWVFSGVDAYGAMIPPRRDEYTAKALMAQQIAGSYIASLGSVPRWFAEGSARVAAAAVQPDDPRVKSWQTGVGSVLQTMNSASDFLTGKLPPEQADVASYSFVEFLKKDSGRYHRLLQSVRQGEDFKQSFSNIYGGSAAQVADRWAAGAARRSRSSRR